MSKFINEYFNYLDEANKAKDFIVINWEKIDDWSQLTIHVNRKCLDSPNKKESECYSPDGFIMNSISEEFKIINNKLMIEPNPVKTMEVIIDEIDGDISLIINGEEWWFIDNENICFVAAYIENKMGLKEDADSFKNEEK